MLDIWNAWLPAWKLYVVVVLFVFVCFFLLLLLFFLFVCCCFLLLLFLFLLLLLFLGGCCCCCCFFFFCFFFVLFFVVVVFSLFFCFVLFLVFVCLLLFCFFFVFIHRFFHARVMECLSVQENIPKNPNYSETRNICCNPLKVQTKWLYHRVMPAKDAHGMANRVDLDKTAPGAIWSGSILFAQTCLFKN